MELVFHPPAIIHLMRFKLVAQSLQVMRAPHFGLHLAAGDAEQKQNNPLSPPFPPLPPLPLPLLFPSPSSRSPAYCGHELTGWWRGAPAAALPADSGLQEPARRVALAAHHREDPAPDPGQDLGEAVDFHPVKAAAGRRAAFLSQNTAVLL